MKGEAQATGLPLRALLLVAVLLHVGVTLQAANPWHPDEHFQILEFAWARDGLAPTSELPWEFEARIRPALQPTMAMVALAGLRAVGVDAPGPWILVLRLLALAAALATLLAVVFRVSPSLSPPGKRALWLSGLFLWFTPLFLSRFTSENLSGMALAGAVVVATGGKGGRRDVVLGLLLGLAFLLRFQVALAALALLAWLVVVSGARWKSLGRVVGAGTLVVAAGAGIDRWFYGAWVFTPWRYFQVNILEGTAASFGTSPWYTYLAQLPLWMAPPLGLAVVALVVVALARRPRSPWGWCLLAFLGGHTLVAHKEIRFMLPMLYLLPPLLAVGWEAVAQRWNARPWYRGLAWLLVAQNAVLALALLTPSIHRGKDFDVHYFRFLAQRADSVEGQVWVLSEDGRPYQVHDVDVHVYRPADVVTVASAGGRLPASLPRGLPPEQVLYVARTPERPTLEGARLRGPVYTAEPGYRVMARRVGLEGSRFLAFLEGVDRWSGWTRNVYEVVTE